MALTVLVAGASVVVDKTNADEVIASASSGACPVVVVAGDVIDVTVPVVSAVATLPKKSVVVASTDSVAPLLGVFVPPVVGLMLAVMTEAVTVAAAVVVTRVVLIVSAVDTAAADDDAVVVFIAAMLFAI